jgi:hypothetical protein
MGLLRKRLFSIRFARPVRKDGLYYLEVKHRLFAPWQLLKLFPYRTESGVREFAKEYTRGLGFVLPMRTE